VLISSAQCLKSTCQLCRTKAPSTESRLFIYGIAGHANHKPVKAAIDVFISDHMKNNEKCDFRDFYFMSFAVFCVRLAIKSRLNTNNSFDENNILNE
jgi:hypothetical protein